MESQTTNQNEGLSVPPPADAKKQISDALRSGKARGKFKSVEEVVSEGIKAGEKEPANTHPEPTEEKTEPIEKVLPEKIEIEVNDETGEKKENVEPVKEEPAPKPTEPPKQAASKKIKIGDKEFTSEDDAITYAQELENQRIVDEAFRQGIEAASQLPGSNSNQSAPVAPSEPEKIDDTYYTNPAVYLAKRDAELLAKATQNITQQFEARQAHERAMTKFWNDYPDLARNQETMELTNAVLQQNFNDLKNVQRDKALKIIAEKARAKLSALGVTTLPTKEIPSTAKPVVSSGSATTVQRPKQEEKQLNMAQFMRQAKVKKAEARRSR